ncbi:hypothetical protein CsSME_00006487 [Camellia sinensis var. sinensis]
MAASIDPLVVGRVIGDVVDMFVPSVTMNVYFGSKHVTNGCDIKPSIASNPPRVTISGHPHQLYTLVMTDPDAPSPSEPSMQFCKFIRIVTDIPGGTGPTQEKEVVAYMGPLPPVGIHRYIVGQVKQPMPRANFNTRAFSHHLDLGMPVATVYFNAHKEPTNRRRSN